MTKQFVELLKEKRIFRWNRKNLKAKALSILIYHAGLSYRKTRKVLYIMRNSLTNMLGNGIGNAKISL